MVVPELADSIVAVCEFHIIRADSNSFKIPLLYFLSNKMVDSSHQAVRVSLSFLLFFLSVFSAALALGSRAPIGTAP